MACPRCGETLHEPGARFCGRCGAGLQAPPPPSQVGPGPRCAVHPDSPAVEICARCGSFACGACLVLDSRRMPLCARCLAAGRSTAWEIPWEQRKQIGRLIAFGRTFTQTCFSPQTTFPGLAPETGRWWDPLSFILATYTPGIALGVLMALGLGGLMAFMGPSGGMSEVAGLVGGGVLAMFLVLGPLLVLVRVFVLAGIEHGLLRLFGGAEGGFEATLRAHCYAGGPALFGMVPGCGVYLSEIWQIVLRILAYRSVHRIQEGWKPVVAVLAPVVVCVGLYMTFGLMAQLLASP